MSLPKIYLRIVANVKAATKSLYRSVTSNQTIVEYHLEQAGIAANNAVAHQRILYAGIAADGHMRTNNAVAD